MLDDTADVEQGSFRQASIAVASELVFAVFPERLVNVHTGTVITNNRFWHKGSSFAVSCGNVVNNVFQHLNFVSFLNQGVEFNADFVLVSRCHFVVVYFNVQTNRHHGVTHSSTDVVRAVHWRNREVTTFNTWTVTQVTTFHHSFSVPGTFFRVDLVERTTHVRAPANVVKDEEFWFRTEECSITQTSRLQEFFSALGHRTRITLIALHGGRLNDVATQNQSCVFSERVQEWRSVVRHQNHVGFVNAFPTGNRGTIEHLTYFEELFFYFRCRDSNVLLFTLGVSEAQVYPLHVIFFDQTQSVL